MEPVTVRRWAPRGAEPGVEEISLLCAGLGVSPLAAAALWGRGVQTVADGRVFLDAGLAALPDPFLLSGMDRGVDRLVAAIEGGEGIAVHGDYDVDGITGTALLVETLRAFGAVVDYHIPLRLKDGYGLSAEALRRAAAAGARVALSVDCGVSAVDEGRLARELGLDLIITDHHQPPETLPEALAIINPHLPESPFPARELSGVGVAFFLMIALRKTLRERGAFASAAEPDLRRSLDLVALGTIADVVPLTGVNRILTRFGLELLGRAGRPGVAALKAVAAVKEMNSSAVGFRLGPRLNAAGRLEDAALGVDLLLETSAARAGEIAGHLDGLNRERQQLEQETLLQAIERLEEGGEGGACSIVLADERWHPGVIGIVASRLVERYHRPTILIALEKGQGKGSARSIPGFHLYCALQDCREFLAGFGGHQYAAGLSLAGEAVDAFSAALDGVAGRILSAEDRVPKLPHDGEILLEDITRGSLGELAKLAPFGAGNPEPAFVARGLRAQQVSVVGEKHLRFTARQGGYSLPCIAFGMAERRTELEGEFDLLFHPGLNEFRNNVSVQLRIRDIRPSV
jgi:single-stranded-DNA-specific exonuclease